MSNSIVGNNGTPQDILTWYEVEVDDDEYEEMEGEIVDEEDMIGYRAICPKNSNSTTVTIYFYYHAPTSEWFWDYMYGLDYKPYIPLIFAADANWNLTECLNASYYETSLTGQSNGWKAFNVNLKRKLVEGERIFFGLYSDLFGYVATGEIEDANTTMCYFYWTRARRRDYASQLAYVSSPDFIGQQRNIFSDWEICIYLQYENEPDGIFYTRSVLGNVGASGAFAGRSLEAKRIMLRTLGLNDSSSRRLSKIISKVESLGASDIASKLLLLIRGCFSSKDCSDTVERKACYHKVIENTFENKESLSRFGESFRSFEEELSVDALPFASRLFYRAVESFMSFWDWLRGKIREANNVLTLYCPIADEITLDCKI